MATNKTDRIEKKVELPAPRSRIWRALSDAAEFGEWFGVKLEGGFAPGKTVKGKITHPGYEHLTFEMMVDRLDPEASFAYRWHPYAIDPKIDYSGETPTRVEFRLEAVPDGTLLTVTESGFDQIPKSRRHEAIRMNEQGWEKQMKNIARHISLVKETPMSAKRRTLWGARSGQVRSSDRRSAFSKLEREIDRQFEEIAHTKTGAIIKNSRGPKSTRRHR